ncbi:MAG: ribonuclease HII [Cyanobacteria bacterium P01_F01_bin.150]
MEYIAGIDEVGRGALFGPVVAGAVILAPAQMKQLAQQGVTDSKKLSAQRREILFKDILQSSTACAIGLASVAEIDRINILQASLLAMKRAIARLSCKPTLCLVDGNQLIPNLAIPQESIVKGDESSLAIASASIIAKVWRDRLIIRMAQRFPQYDLMSNKGYGTQKHRDAIQKLGPCRYHRLSFKPCQVSTH